MWAGAHDTPANAQRGLAATLRELKPGLRELARGTHLFQTIDTPDFVYLIESGSLKLYLLSPEGDEQTIGFRFAGDILGLEALGACEYGCAAVALEHTRVRAVPRQMLAEMGQRDPALQHELFSQVSRRIAELEEQMLMLGRLGAAERLAAFLVRLSARLLGRESGRAAISLSMSRYDIASYLGMAFETVSRLLGQFEHDGLIRVERRRVFIENRERLHALAGIAQSGGGLRLVPAARAHATHGHA
jgi:CRP/FNR family transcriptional regulator